MKKIVIAIDGYSSTGKSTVAKALAKALGYVYVDTGAMYRAVTLFALRADLVSADDVDAEELIKRLPEIELRFVFNADLGYGEMFLNGENVEKEIRGMAVSQVVSQVAQIPEVRALLVKQQHAMGKDKGIVMDGRDIGTVVFPEAELKLFMTASAQIRAERRFKDLQEKGEAVSFEEVLHNIETRDYIDTTRKDSPLVKADDAVEVDNSHLTREAQLQRLLDLAEERIKM